MQTTTSSHDSLSSTLEFLSINDNDPGVFHQPQDKFRCVALHSAKISYDNPQHFEDKLKKSLAVWSRDGTRAVWLHVCIEHSDLIPGCVRLGFIYHHAHESYAMLKLWLAQDESDNLPPFASQFLGCGGFVLNDNNEVLVVKEKYHDDPHWKFPGGHAEPGEEISEAAEREDFEETGIRAKFQAVICFRHQHNYKFKCSDFYFVSLMRPLTLEIRTGANEISECVWMKLPEYLQHPKVTEFNRHIAFCYLESLRTGGVVMEPLAVSSFHSSKEKNLVYSIANLESPRKRAASVWRSRQSDSEDTNSSLSSDSDPT